MNWMLQNFGPRFRFALRNPRYVAASLFRELTLADERLLSSITGVSPSGIRSFAERFHDAATSRILRGVGFLQKDFS